MIVVNKPPGTACLAESQDRTGLDLLSRARRYNDQLQICHRIDKWTSGIIVFAKDPDTFRNISMQFQEREVVKHYVAVVDGTPNWEEFEIDMPIFMTSGGPAKIHYGRGKESFTIVSTLEKFRQHALVECHPLTGRTHQIRVHLAQVGHAITGDELYGGKPLYLSDYKKNFQLGRGKYETPVNDGYLLHARGIQFVIPGNSEPSTFVADLSKNFEVALKQLRKYGGQD